MTCVPFELNAETNPEKSAQRDDDAHGEGRHCPIDVNGFHAIHVAAHMDKPPQCDPRQQ